jgi:glucosamine-6-phosphate deaminase
MKIIKVKNYKEMSEKAEDIIIKDINRRPTLTIAFATGKTPLGLYKLLVKAYKKKKVDFSKIKAFNLDEYYPIKKSDKRSFYYYLYKNLFNKVNIKRKNINLLNGMSKDYEKECKDYENRIKKNPIDLQILGVSFNGHIGFNEPGSLKESKTRLVELFPETIKKIEDIKKGLTIGISTIMKSKKTILLASGKNKAKSIKYLVKCKPDSCCPVSFLKKHKNLIIIIDKEAGSLL